MNLAVKEADYTANGVTHGLSLLKAVVGATSVDTRYTTVYIDNRYIIVHINKLVFLKKC